MKSILPLVSLIAFQLAALGQTNAAHNTNALIVLTTNRILADKNFREFNNQLYNIQRSQLWTQKSGEVIGVENGVMIFQSYSEGEYAAPATDSLVGSGNFLGSGGNTTRHTIKRKKYEAIIAVTNIPKEYDLTVGKDFTLILIRAGKYEYNGNPIELWDWGKPHYATIVRTNTVKQ